MSPLCVRQGAIRRMSTRVVSSEGGQTREKQEEGAFEVLEVGSKRIELRSGRLRRSVKRGFRGSHRTRSCSPPGGFAWAAIWEPAALRIWRASVSSLTVRDSRTATTVIDSFARRASRSSSVEGLAVISRFAQMRRVPLRCNGPEPQESPAERTSDQASMRGRASIGQIRYVVAALRWPTFSTISASSGCYPFLESGLQERPKRLGSQGRGR